MDYIYMYLNICMIFWYINQAFQCNNVLNHFIHMIDFSFFKQINKPAWTLQELVVHCLFLSLLQEIAKIPQTTSSLWRLLVTQYWRIVQPLATWKPALSLVHFHSAVSEVSCDQTSASFLPCVCLALSPQWKHWKKEINSLDYWYIEVHVEDHWTSFKEIAFLKKIWKKAIQRKNV